MLSTLLHILHIAVCLFLIFVVLLQQGRGGGMGAAFGGGAQQVFGGRGAGNLLTRATAICATLFMLTSVGLAYMSSSGDRDLKAKLAQEQKKIQSSPRPKETAKDAPKDSKAGAAGGAQDAPASTPSSSPAP